jgi:hypothetical protein
MTAWATESGLAHALAELQERYPGEAIEIVETFDIAWVGWECDANGALITHDGFPEIVIIDQVGVDGRSVPDIVTTQLGVLKQLIERTEVVLAKYRGMGGLEGYRLVEAHQRQHERRLARGGEEDNAE